MNGLNGSFLIKCAVCFILFMHSVPTMITGSINDFGNLYLAPLGFGWFGLPLAWLIKLSHVATIISLLLNKWVKVMSIITILVLVCGIFLVHAAEGWFVVGGGRNGIEFNFLLIIIFIGYLLPERN